MTHSKTEAQWFAFFRRASRTPALGKRELSVLEVLWDSAPLTAQQVYQRVGYTRIGLNTVQSTLERLCRKGLIRREKTGRAYSYSPRTKREELISSLLADIERDIASGDMAAMISGFRAYIDEQRLRSGNPPLPQHVSDDIGEQDD